MSLRAFILLTLLAATLFASPASADVRALVIGADYTDAAEPRLRLANTLIDARSIAATLDEIGVESVVLVVNPDADGWRRAVDAFVRSLAREDVALVYYAGHGLQAEGANYFLGADGNALIPMDLLVAEITRRSQAAVFVVDACRNNPFLAGATARNLYIFDGVISSLETQPSRAAANVAMASPGGLSQLSNIRGVNAIAFFSTDPGNIASDGAEGAGSPFARVFAQELRRRNSLDTVLRRTTRRVNGDTRGRQSPWRQGDVGFNIYLAGQPDFPVP